VTPVLQTESLAPVAAEPRLDSGGSSHRAHDPRDKLSEDAQKNVMGYVAVRLHGKQTTCCNSCKENGKRSFQDVFPLWVDEGFFSRRH